jgi:hypothetical protein
VLLVTTDRRHSLLSLSRLSVRCASHSAVVVLIRLCSSTFIGIRIDAARQVADVNGLWRNIIQTPEIRLYAAERGSRPLMGVAWIVCQSTPQCRSSRSR